MPTALGIFGMTYDFFMSLTPRQWAYYVKGFEQSEEQKNIRLAWALAHLMNASGNMKQPITAEMLIKELKGERIERKPDEKMDFKEISRWVR